MCEPVIVASAITAATALAGTAMQVRGQQQADKAGADTIRAESARQAGFAEANRGRVDQTLGQVSRSATDETTQRAAGERTAAYAAATPQQAGYLPGQDAAPQIVRDEVDRRRGVADLFVRQQQGARANLGGFGDAMFGTGVALDRSAQDIRTGAGFARGSASVLTPEQMAARQVGGNMRLAGDLTVAGGQLAAPYAGRLSGLFATPQGSINPNTGVYRPMEVQPGGRGGF